MNTHIEKQKTFLSHLANLRDISQKNNLGASLIEKLNNLESNIQDCELVIPVVGGFSSGKSTMLNTLLGVDILPTAIKPETSLACELHYSEEQYLEAITVDGTATRFDPSNIKTVSNNAASWAYVRLYLNNTILKKIEPLILVDMPGFDAPLEQHNKAIMAYMLRGCHYFVLCDAQAGTLSRTLLRHMHEIESYNRGLSLFISKIDLKPANEIEDIIKHVRELLDYEFDQDISLASINNHSVKAVTDAISLLKPDTLFTRIYTPNLTAICNELMDVINLKLKSSQKDSQQLIHVIEEMRLGVDKLKSKAGADIEHMRRAYSTNMIDDIIKSVGEDLNLSCDELVYVLESSGQNQAEGRLNDIVRGSLFSAIKNKLGEINIQICKEFSSSLEGIDRILKEEELDDAFIENLSSKIQTAFNTIQDMLRDSGGKAASLMSGLSKSSALCFSSKAVGAGIATTGILASTASIAMPVIGILLMFLPEILGAVFKNANKEKVRAAIRSKLEGDVFPSIKRKLRETLPEQLESQVSSMIEAVREQYNILIEEKMNTIKEMSAKHAANQKEHEEVQLPLEAAREKVKSILNQLA